MLLQKAMPRSISLLTFNVLLAIWLGVFLNIAFYQKMQALTPYTGLKAGLFVVASVGVVTALYLFALQILNWKWTAKPIAIALIFIGGFAAYAVNTLGVWITADQIQNLMQTDIAEAKDTWSWHLLVWIIGMVIVPIIVILLIKLKPEPIIRQIWKKVVASLVSLAMVGGLLFIFYVDFAAIFRENRDLKGMISPQNMIAASVSYYKKKAPKENLPLVHYGEDAQVSQTPKGVPKLMVLVVGETARAENFSLNGYAKETNPKLAKQDILNFSQVSSCGTATAVSVPCMFSGMQRVDYDERLASHREGLLDIAKRVGYQVTWIDNNSSCKGTCDRIGEYKIPESIKQKWCKDGECLDDILIDSLKAYLETIPKDDKRPQLVVLHQMGSHGPAYYKRAPEEFRVFKPTCDTNAIQGCTQEALINTYDNTLLYTDYVLDSLINTLKNTTQYQTGLWYLSDHGESTGESGMYLHGAPYAIAPSQQTHVPMLMWFSSVWQQQASKQIKCLAQQSKNKLSQDNLFPTMLSLLDIKTKVINPKDDMLQTCPKP
ncbi:phosphoethanolamine--lipid A transferase [Acinetobacter sp. C26M]|uniref:phosphoethanolamine transferase n=1 Tax=unclassified Acinetobacter TaxID=196816 RepID=UPI002036E17D|nr:MULTISPECIES: phosphoethanolamine--lipid A transferase [unclassified Acinetobacter]USA45877.1 phosphoethanolamine--lipid A transferase [Acinetobacter sp. C26M]USA49360.1 phosphoethanolamine--lipid A transferase [Acinetobacter sp. C26G]